MKHTVTFYFDHIPGLMSEAIFPFRNAKRAPGRGWTRYSVTVEFDDGSMGVESVCIDGEPKGAVVLTTDGTAKYEYPDR